MLQTPSERASSRSRAADVQRDQADLAALQQENRRLRDELRFRAHAATYFVETSDPGAGQVYHLSRHQRHVTETTDTDMARSG